ncbi:MAG: hypothetical protein U1E53_23305 [Dongiaceae bacterium]
MRPSILVRMFLWLVGRPVSQRHPRRRRAPRHERLGNHLRRDIGLHPVQDWERWN